MKLLPLAVLFALNSQIVAAEAPTDNRLSQAMDAIKQGRPADAVKLAGAVSDDFQRAHPRSNTHCVYSATSLSQSLLYAAISTKAGCKDSEVVTGDFAEAYFAKGFALYDLGRFDEAIKAYDEAIALAPLTPRFWLERAEGYKSLRQWDKAFKDFESAAGNAQIGDLDDQVAKASDLARAYRGMAFAKVEQNDLKAARTYLEKALKAKPDDPRTKSDFADLEQRERR
jgi:tetratricopeptide (TPR) repeat protein